MHTRECFGYKIRIKFDNDALAVEQNKYATKIVNVYIAYGLDTWPRNPLCNFALKNCLFGSTNIVKIAIKRNGFTAVMEQHFMEKVCGVLVVVLLEIL